MKEIKFKQENNPQLGEIIVHIRIIGKIIYLKTNNQQYSDTMLQQLSSKGAVIVKGREWLRINMFSPELTMVKLGNYMLDLVNDTDEQIEDKIGNFYSEKYIEAGFKII